MARKDAFAYAKAMGITMKRYMAILLILTMILISLASCAQQTTVPSESQIPSMSLSDFSTVLSQSEESTPSRRIGVSGVAFPERELMLQPGTVYAIKAQVLPENATNQNIRYSVSDGTVISYENGLLTAFSEGTATLTAVTEEDEYIARCFITVSSDAPTILPSSETPTIVTTDPSTESTSPSYTPDKVYVEGVRISETTIFLTVYQSHTFTASVLPSNADDQSVTYEVSDQTILSLDGSTITAKKEGEATVTVRTRDGGFTAHCTVTVGESIPNAFRYDENGLPAYTPTFDPDVEYYDFKAANTLHLFCHNLVAFDDDSDYFFNDCITVTEFKRILEQLYERDYILIDIDYMYSYAWDGDKLTATLKNTIKLPKGKKAIILSVDNVAYPRGEHGKGRCDRLQVVDGQLMTYTKMPDGSNLYSTDNEVFTILEGFVKEHPDFSFSGAKCVVCPSGYEGLFGWDTIPGSANYAQSMIEAKKIVEWFNAHGFAFACHSYYHKDFKTMTVEQIENDLEHWMNECYPLVGRTHIFIYPFGSFTVKDSEQAKALSRAGFAVFCATSYYGVNWNNFPLAGNCYNERITLASALFVRYKDNEMLNRLFDPYAVYDNDAHRVKLIKEE